VAPLTAVRGNNDRERWAAPVPETAVVRIGRVAIYVLHNLAELDIDPAGKYNVVIAGHSHKPLIKKRDGVLYVNPGSAGPRRFTLPIALGELRISGTRVRARIKELT
jgi:putative phosphoesterase